MAFLGFSKVLKQSSDKWQTAKTHSGKGFARSFKAVTRKWKSDKSHYFVTTLSLFKKWQRNVSGARLSACFILCHYLFSKKSFVNYNTGENLGDFIFENKKAPL